jgi:hypothetical protein
MADIHPFTGSRAHTHPSPRATINIDPANEAIRRGVQYLAFRIDDGDLAASYEPGPGQVRGVVARAARAALEAHRELAQDIGASAHSPTRITALASRLKFTRQLTEVKAGVTPAPTIASRSAYLDALADFMIEVVHHEGVKALEAWARQSKLE